jgi:hypothetical protein
VARGKTLGGTELAFQKVVVSDKPSESTTELLLLATERQVYAFDLSLRSRVTIGRHESNDLQLASRTVSNFHAEIVIENGGLHVRDLGSTNGTHVNERHVDAERVNTGDQIRVGNHVMTLELKAVDGPEGAFLRYQKSPQVLSHGTRGSIISMSGRSADAVKTMRGVDPNDFTFPDLLKLLTSNMQSVRAVIRRGDHVARVVIHKQNIVHAEYGDAVGEKALYRLFGWRNASYEVEALEPADGLSRTIALPVETLVVEGMAHAVELGRLVATLPPLEAALRIKEDCPLPMTAHSPEEIEVFQLIVRHETIAAVVESSALADVRVLRLIDSLLRKGVFETARGTDATLSGTVLPESLRTGG